MQHFSGELADTNFKINVMKNLILLTCLLFSVCVFAQETTVKKSLEEVQVSPPEFTGIENVAALLKPNNSEIVYAGTHYGGIYKTTDAGLSWKKTNNGLTGSTGVFDLVIDSNNSNALISLLRNYSLCLL